MSRSVLLAVVDWVGVVAVIVVLVAGGVVKATMRRTLSMGVGEGVAVGDGSFSESSSEERPNKARVAVGRVTRSKLLAPQLMDSWGGKKVGSYRHKVPRVSAVTDTKNSSRTKMGLHGAVVVVVKDAIMACFVVLLLLLLLFVLLLLLLLLAVFPNGEDVTSPWG